MEKLQDQGLNISSYFPCRPSAQDANFYSSTFIQPDLSSLIKVVYCPCQVICPMKTSSADAEGRFGTRLLDKISIM